ncbi:hypothetical protein HanRHA438_Chr04g0189221 [Helianthus annuus]|nr:hypothetical protein HanIR_Chr04g0193271 [Helianthus annuus]KAJ0928000.1 hypothetical protein HanRHA438_Chr04g0189221 [Helianthus annuus]
MCGTSVAGALYRITSLATASVYRICLSSSAVISLSLSGDQIPATSSLTLDKTSGCESSNVTAQSSDEVEASCDANRKSNRWPPISVLEVCGDGFSPESSAAAISRSASCIQKSTRHVGSSPNFIFVLLSSAHTASVFTSRETANLALRNAKPGKSTGNFINPTLKKL